mmetsp:Transcript_20024/g.64843  ORF Transcript_20024/g.64843 Transcript_20024/m.64843 type:complete len:240 (-) Transcript_20024:1328-2047(-)
MDAMALCFAGVASGAAFLAPPRARFGRVRPFAGSSTTTGGAGGAASMASGAGCALISEMISSVLPRPICSHSNPPRIVSGGSSKRRMVQTPSLRRLWKTWSPEGSLKERQAGWRRPDVGAASASGSARSRKSIHRSARFWYDLRAVRTPAGWAASGDVVVTTAAPSSASMAKAASGTSSRSGIVRRSAGTSGGTWRSTDLSRSPTVWSAPCLSHNARRRSSSTSGCMKRSLTDTVISRR